MFWEQVKREAEAAAEAAAKRHGVELESVEVDTSRAEQILRSAGFEQPTYHKVYAILPTIRTVVGTVPSSRGIIMLFMKFGYMYSTVKIGEFKVRKP